MKFALKLKGKRLPRAPIIVHVRQADQAQGASMVDDDYKKRRGRVVIVRKRR